MPKKRKIMPAENDIAANVGHEAELWRMDDVQGTA
jgi:hypothetical protein